MPFRFSRLAIPGLILVEPGAFSDSRGFFMECYKLSDFASNGIPGAFVQSNLSHSSKNVLRGLHFQKDPFAQGKLVQCLGGEIWDVAVDIRSGSPTFGSYVGETLSEENHRMLYLPPGFAHGFVVLSDQADVMYQCTREYSPAHESGIVWNDPAIGIKWPCINPLLSDKDAGLPGLRGTSLTT
ncbi:MAG: dTDP-4-dehydrorhamnose 3,5-epimerase [Myxococcota bacterium]|jgi:dTDP-4-dehydrorhamnose 3,5-epimerase